MDVTTPPINSIQTLFPQFTAIQHIATEGFKAVFKVSINGSEEALKLIQLPDSDGSEESEAQKRESHARAQREVEALNIFQTPEIVKLGSVVPELKTIDGHEYLVYSEEFIHGSDLKKLIRDTSEIPSEVELKRLGVSLVNAIKEMSIHEYVHRDIKPLNVIKTSESQRPYVLLDLGVAFALHGERITSNPNAKAGTLSYIPSSIVKCNTQVLKAVPLQWRHDETSIQTPWYRRARSVVGAT